MTSEQIGKLTEIHDRIERALTADKSKFVIDRETLKELSRVLGVCIQEGGIIDDKVGVI